MALTTAQRKQITDQFEVLAAKLLAGQLIVAARDATREVMAEEPGIPWAKDEDVTELHKGVPEAPEEKQFFRDKSKFGKQEDAAEQTNKLHEGQQDLNHALRWLASYYKALKPVLERFTRKMLKEDVGNLNQSHVQQMAGILSAVLRLAEVLDAAGATVSDVTDMIKTLEKQLVFRQSDDAKKSKIRKILPW